MSLATALNEKFHHTYQIGVVIAETNASVAPPRKTRGFRALNLVLASQPANANRTPASFINLV